MHSGRGIERSSLRICSRRLSHWVHCTALVVARYSASQMESAMMVRFLELHSTGGTVVEVDYSA